MEANKRTETSLALFGLIAATIIFGSVGIVAPYTGLKAFELVFVRCLSATLFLGAGWVLSGRIRQEEWNKRELIQTALCGFALVANWYCLFSAFELIPVTLAVAVYYLAPVFVLLSGVLFFGERLTLVSLLSVLACFAGTALIAAIGSETPTALWSSGLLWALMAAICYATLTVLGKGIQRLSPYAVSCLQTLLGALLLPAFVHFGAFTTLTQGNWLAVALMGSIHTGLVYYLFFGSVRKLPTRLVSVLVYLDPVVAMMLDIGLNGFRPSHTQWIGIALMAAGLGLSAIRQGSSNTRSIPTKFEGATTHLLRAGRKGS
ncbi:DMT family transporter [Chitinimonas sp. PSY-7]|uniref:EamA family transporter n=1 Tax=Chitinimonas sp. PSY-7 TaxID=3459088 RepID=UPI00403FEE64